jgi:chromatin structure-remodeling complex subunit SFH1
VQISTQILRDKIEWDLSSTLPPTTFALAYTRDLGLSGEATPLIAHAITEEILRHKKDALDLRLFRATHPNEQAKWEKTTNTARVNHRTGAKGLKGVWRDWFEREEFGPVLIQLTLEDMERREVERNREQRRIMRGVIGKRRR